MSVSFFGRNRQLSILKDEFANARNGVFNLFGFRGAGKSVLLSHIEEIFEEKETSWPMRLDQPTKVIYIDCKGFHRASVTGQSIESKTSQKPNPLLPFIDFFITELAQQCNISSDKQATAAQSEDDKHLPASERVQAVLDQCSDGKNLIVLVDNFTSTLNSMTAAEAQQMRLFRTSNPIFYIFVTDHRQMEEIKHGIRSLSPFFQHIIPIGLTPLLPISAAKLVSALLKQTSRRHENELTIQSEHPFLIELVKTLAGGHPALLKHTLDYLLTHPWNDQLAQWNAEGLGDRNRSALRLIIEDFQIEKDIAQTLMVFNENRGKEGDAEAAVGQNKASEFERLCQFMRSDKEEGLRPSDIRNWRVWGILDSHHAIKPQFNGLLIEYALYQHCHAVTKGVDSAEKPLYFDQYYEQKKIKFDFASTPDPKPTRRRGSGGGRPTFAENDWAAEQIHTHMQDEEAVFQEWIRMRQQANRRGKNLRELFNKAIKLRSD